MGRVEFFLFSKRSAIDLLHIAFTVLRYAPLSKPFHAFYNDRMLDFVKGIDIYTEDFKTINQLRKPPADGKTSWQVK